MSYGRSMDTTAVTVDDYVRFREDGFLIGRGVLDPGEVRELLDHGDAGFFGGHVLHRSHANRSDTRSRKPFVGHYCNAGSRVPWETDHGPHPLASGSTRLPRSRPKFLLERVL